MSLAANSSVEAADGDALWLLATGITFSLRDLSTRALAVEEELAEDDDDVDRAAVAEFVAGATEIFDRTPSPL